MTANDDGNVFFVGFLDIKGIVDYAAARELMSGEYVLRSCQNEISGIRGSGMLVSTVRSEDIV